MHNIKTKLNNYDQYGDIHEQLQSLIEKKHWEKAVDLNHKLKGVAGSLFIQTVFESAESLETTLQNKLSEQSMDLINSLTKALDELKQEVLLLAC